MRRSTQQWALNPQNISTRLYSTKFNFCIAIPKPMLKETITKQFYIAFSPCFLCKIHIKRINSIELHCFVHPPAEILFYESLFQAINFMQNRQVITITKNNSQPFHTNPFQLFFQNNKNADLSTSIYFYMLQFQVFFTLSIFYSSVPSWLWRWYSWLTAERVFHRNCYMLK